MIEQAQLTFRPLGFADIPIIHRWFNEPHVQQFYSLRAWTEDEVLKKLEPYILGTQPVHGFMIIQGEAPIGYVQSYKVSDYSWSDQDLPEEIVSTASGMDLFIGDSALIGKGIGQRIVSDFLKQNIWPDFQYCIIDPDIRNTAAIRCYEQLGFVEHTLIRTVDTLNGAVILKLTKSMGSV